MMSNARESIRKMLTVLVLVLSLMAAGLAYAPPAEALACPTGKVVWIKSNTTINAGHGWSIYYNFWSWGGWHTTVTHMQNSGTTWIDTDGTLHSGQIYCALDAS